MIELDANDFFHLVFLPRSVMEIAACAPLPFLPKMRMKGNEIDLSRDRNSFIEGGFVLTS